MLRQHWDLEDMSYEPDYDVRAVRLTRLGDEPYEGGAWVIVDPQSTMTEHVNPTGESEIFFVVQGSGLMRVESEASRVEPGEVILVPPGDRHSLYNDGDTPLRLLALWWGAAGHAE